MPWTFTPDGLLRSGDSVILRNKKNNGYLAVDIGSRQAGVEESYLINSSKTIQGPTTRAVFVLTRVESADVFGNDSIIRFG